MWIQIQSFLQKISQIAGKTVAILTLVMVITMFANTLLSNAFNINFIAFQEAVSWMHALVFMLGAAYTLQANEHVRVDIFYQRFSKKTQAIIDMSGTVFLLFPLCIFILINSWGFIELSWRLSEKSAEAGGLSFVFLIKSIVLVMPTLLIIEGLAQIIKNAGIFQSERFNSTKGEQR